MHLGYFVYGGKGIRKKSLDTEFIGGSSPESGDELGSFKERNFTGNSTVFGAVWKVLEEQLVRDPYPEVASMANRLLNQIMKVITPESPALFVTLFLCCHNLR